MIWFSDLIEPSSNFKDFFSAQDNKILDCRNVWLLDYRNMGDSDHHKSFDMSVSYIIYKFFLFYQNYQFSKTMKNFSKLHFYVKNNYLFI
jgi:hypothetical protein